MNLISRDTDYALRALLFMAKAEGELFSVRQLSRRLGVPYAFLRRILQQLAKGGMLISARGSQGGFMLKKNLGEITIFAVAKIFQGNINMVNCILKGKPCPQIRLCPLRKRLKKIEKEVIATLKQASILSLLKEGGKNGRKKYSPA